MKSPREQRGDSTASLEPVAIVGLGGVFPGAPTLAQFWEIVRDGRDVSRPVPPGRWVVDPALVCHSTVGTPDRVYTDRGCFVDDFSLDPRGLDVPAELLAPADPAVPLILEAGRQAWESASTRRVDRGRVGVVLGNIALPTASSSAWCDRLLNAWLGRTGRAFDWRSGALNRCVTSLPAGILARALGFGAGSRTLDAACASSLYAVKLACDELQAGRVDLMLAGGLSRADSLYTQMGFSQLRALATSGRCAPFDASASGLIVGEGAGVVALKRLGDALRDGDRIRAVIRGVGLSNDLEGNLLSPSSEGQVRALREAYARAGWTPGQVDLIECHATGTPVGDAVEFESLLRLWGSDASSKPGQCALGAVKANVGHLLTGAGAAGLIKVLLALEHESLPPVANFTRPSPRIPLAGSPFRVLQQSEPWTRRDAATPRRAAVNGFGFGGINAHLLIEEWLAPTGTRTARRRRVKARPVPAAPVAIVGLATWVGPWSTLDRFQERVLGGGDTERPVAPAQWRGIEAADDQDGTELAAGAWPGYYLDDLSLPVQRYRIPPRELAEMLPQQILMLEVARAALADTRSAAPDSTRNGVFVGLGLDARTMDFHHRWSALGRAGVETGPPAASGVTATPASPQVAQDAGPALTADRTLGALGGLCASRIAKEFHFGGPSYTVSAEEGSGLRALELAVQSLRLGELDRAVAGAVDLCGDWRSLWAAHAVKPYSKSGSARPFDTAADGAIPGEGAVALVLKRLDDALRDGDRVYAVVRGLGVAGGAGVGSEPLAAATYRAALERAYADAGVPPASVGYVEAHGSALPEEDRREAEILAAYFGAADRLASCYLGCAKADVGHTGAASGLVAVAKACLALYHEVLPPWRGIEEPIPELTRASGLRVPSWSQYWVRNRAEGPRRAGVSSVGLDGNCLHVVLEASEASPPAPRPSPLSCPEALFTLRAQTPADLLARLQSLRELASSGVSSVPGALSSAGNPQVPLETLARAWHRANSSGKEPAGCALALVAQDREQLLRLVERAVHRVNGVPVPLPERRDRERVFYTPPEERVQGQVAFVFPGSGNAFAEMGRELALRWPEIGRAQDRENQWLARQMHAEVFWNCPVSWRRPRDHRALICGQVALGAWMADLASSFGLQPQAAIGYSLGESASLFALRAWTARDDMLRRVSESTLFTRDLVGDPEVLARCWGAAAGRTVAWRAGWLDRSAAEVRAQLGDLNRVYILIVNTPRECVVGGDQAQIEVLLERLACHWWPLEGVSTVHCELLRPFEAAYRELHRFETTPPPGVRFYSGGWGRAYVPDRDTAAEAIVAQARDGIDFPRVIQAAYDSGVRFFVELGPGNSCSRIIDRILDQRPHVARSLCVSAQEPVLGFFRGLACLHAEGIPLHLDALYGVPLPAPAAAHLEAQPQVRVSLRGQPWIQRATGESRPSGTEAASASEPAATPLPFPPAPPVAAAAHAAPVAPDAARDPFEAECLSALVRSQESTLAAHQAFLDFAQRLSGSLSQSVRTQLDLLAADPALAEGVPVGSLATPAPLRAEAPAVIVFPPVEESPGISAGKSDAGQPLVRATGPSPVGLSEPKRALDRTECLEFARGSVARVLGPEFAPADGFPTRVRLPDEPLMLVDRILEIEATPRSMTSGRVVTEHDVLPAAWYLDCGRIPTCIAVEAGQADLFLSGYLGIDFITQGKAVYRLLDARVCFHQGLPEPGKTIRYDIRIDGFFRQSDTWLFRFRFEATVDGRPLLSMTDGCAGFFSASELASGRGIVRPAIDRQPLPGKRAADWEDFVAMEVQTYSAAQLDSLRAGDFAACFGPAFAGLRLARPLTLPAGRMKLVHRIAHLDPAGGRFGLGLIRGEADIRPDDWFLTCHFVDDRVMPGTLMFECCLHTLRVFLLRMGWIVERDRVALEPVPGLVSQLKCRGQVLETTQTVTYEISLKEVGYRPEPYVVADALMYADGKPIVEIVGMSLRYAGVTREDLRRTWSGASARCVLYERERILAFAVGKPSAAFGEPYRVFDERRRIARLPGPPFQFLDRVTDVRGEPFKLTSGGEAEAEYDVPPEEWYFGENRQGDMPFAVLLEIALQPCGWLAAYQGSALTSETDLSFRNLGGAAVQHWAVYPDTGTLTTRVKLTRFSSSAGMIIQWFDFAVRAGTQLVYQGDTYFGFFPQASLARQEGLHQAALYSPSAQELARQQELDYPREAPFPGDRLRMVDRLECYLPEGGPRGLGFVRATKQVDPAEWFFQAHFYQDPVVPGSLGLESFLQLLKFLAVQRWGHRPGDRWEAVALGARHEWVYRGQIIPANRRVTIEAAVTEVNERDRLLSADGYLSVDGRPIYALKQFTVRHRPPAG